jgi:hypothetical protein
LQQGAGSIDATVLAQLRAFVRFPDKLIGAVTPAFLMESKNAVEKALCA